MFTIVKIVFIFIVANTYGQILVYNTDNHEVGEKFDCIYHIDDDLHETPYCRRLNASHQVARKRNTCENEGEMKFFQYLFDHDVNPEDIVNWNSSIEMIENYAAAYYNRLLTENYHENFVCECQKLGTFGKYCEYELIDYIESFEQALTAQFEEKKNGDSWNNQRYGKILCYETLFCNLTNRCLDWRDICDNYQHCSNGFDEENCDKLEFNECEDDEFRCINGMCIAEDFWLDGDLDCMDWSDELFSGDGESCPYKASSITCDEHICRPNLYSCGDGQCILWLARMAHQRFEPPLDDCFSKRNLYYMCEASRRQYAWTLENGLCSIDTDYDDLRYPSWNIINSSNLTNNEKCQYLFRCILSNNFEHDCPCSYLNCTQMMMNICSSDQYVLYPPEGVINSNILFYYDYTKYLKDFKAGLILFIGNIRCRGYNLIVHTNMSLQFQLPLFQARRITYLPCLDNDDHDGYRNLSSSFQYNEFCWNESQTFNGHSYAVNPDICEDYGECISQYRIRDGATDCISQNDEKIILEKDYCTGNVGKQRFKCYNVEYKCLTMDTLGTGFADCSNGYDELLYEIDNINLFKNTACHKYNDIHCNRLKKYVQLSSDKNSTNATFLYQQPLKPVDRLRFQSYCDTFWDLNEHKDELTSSCKHWICRKNQYQCLTGQCIPLNWVCDGEWDCSDASDEESIVLIQNWSLHNHHLIGLKNRIKECQQRYSQSPFSNRCNISFEYGCYRSQINNPLDIYSYQPCINLTQIGDEKEDCYNGYDEKNTFGTSTGMLGFQLICQDKILLYEEACFFEKKTNCSQILCSNQRDQSGLCSDKDDVICIEDNQCKKGKRCDGHIDCVHGEDEYWCSTGSYYNKFYYRHDKQISRRYVLSPTFASYPLDTLLTKNQEQKSRSSIKYKKNENFKNYSHLCNQGVAIRYFNQIECLCPPAYYGRWCEFFSDRISIITRIHRKTLPISLEKKTFLIQSKLLFNDLIMDYDEFIISPISNTSEYMKNEFYLLYSRSNQTLIHKQKRFLNRTDIIHNHPYSIHFNIFILEINNTIQPLGSWIYPIYFDYLPAFRLAVLLKFPSWFDNSTNNPCSRNLCNTNSICISIFNKNTFYCSCKSKFFGKYCEFSDHQCDMYCSTNSFCQRNHDNNIVTYKNPLICICPLNYFGKRCYLKYNDCNRNPCMNNGICLLTYSRSREKSFICICTERFYGRTCNYMKAIVHINLKTANISSMVHASLIQLYNININTPTRELQIKNQQVFYGLISTIDYYHHYYQAPELGLLTIYKNNKEFQYFIIYFLSQSVINITSYPTYCPHVLSLLLKDIDDSIPYLFQYHRICRNNSELFCFYDENQLCICANDHQLTECFGFDKNPDDCNNCLSGGQCIQGDLLNETDFICLCPYCYQGYRCEFSMHTFGFTVDSLLVHYSIYIKISYASLTFLFFLIGFFNNLCCFVTFKRTEPRKYPVGNYLLILICFNQFALLIILLKFIHIIIQSSNIGFCKINSYFLSVSTRLTYWLMTWITVNRFLIVLFPTSSILTNSRLAIRICILTSIILFLLHIHEILYYTTIKHHLTDSFICVTNFHIHFISSYDRISTLIHYLLPFIIQIISITLLIILIARSRIKAKVDKSNFILILKKQFQNQTELYVMPIVVILSALPQAVLTFSFACTYLSIWQHHLLLVTYLFSYIPQVLGFVLYILPSSSYRKEFKASSLGKKIFEIFTKTPR